LHINYDILCGSKWGVKCDKMPFDSLHVNIQGQWKDTFSIENIRVSICRQW